MERPTAEGKGPVREIDELQGWHQSSTGQVEPGVKPGGQPPKPKYYKVFFLEYYREGKVKRTPGGE